jgi:GH15 family glucan-1,4-alpha-glucosidase
VSAPIEDYAFISDTHSAGLVSRDGSIDWLTFPRFDSSACFAALLGDEHNGRWRIAPAGKVTKCERRYLPDSLVLETVFHTPDGSVALIDCMPPRDRRLDLVRIVEGRSGRVPMRMDLTMRMDYGSIVPWVRNTPGGLSAVAGPDGLRLTTPVDTFGENLSTAAEFEVRAHTRVPFTLSWYPSSERPPMPIDAVTGVESTVQWWQRWSEQCTYSGDYEEDVRSSLRVLKGLTYAPSGGIVAAGTTSLPETLGGERNWDYRYCWLRDATFSLMALLECGYLHEARAWRDWLLRAVAGKASQLQIMYGPEGERRLSELELDWLGGYEGSKPVRVGNAAHSQFQLDVYGEVIDATYQSRVHGLPLSAGWDLALELIDFVEKHWCDPDDGIWEVRGGRRHFTHSKVMAWVAVDRAIRAIEGLGQDGPIDKWKALRAEIHDDVLHNGVDDRGVFVQSYGSSALDASLLMVPLVGFLPPDDPRVRNTVAAIEKELTEDGFVRRYLTDDDSDASSSFDGLSGKEGIFLMCTFWLADNYVLLGRQAEARALFEKLLSLRNDVGLLAEQYDPRAKRQLGNVPQAFSHVSLVNTATNLTRHHLGAARRRSDGTVEGDDDNETETEF